MARVLMATQAWGVLQDRYGNAQVGTAATMQNLDSSPATHWDAKTNGTSSTAAIIADARGRLMRWIEEGAYTQTIGGETLEVRAVDADRESDIAAWARLTRPSIGAFPILAETIPRAYCSILTTALTSGKLRTVPIYLPAGTPVGVVGFVSRQTAMVSPTNWWFALYDKNRVLLRQTADQLTAAWAASTVKYLALSTSYTIPASDIYLLGCMTAAATPPNLAGNDSFNILNQLDPQYSGTTADTGLTTTAPNPAGAITGAGGTPYAFVF